MGNAATASMIIITALCLATGCTKVELTTELKNVSGSSDRLLTRAAEDIGTNVNLESLQIPILDVALGTSNRLSGGDGNANTAYSCDAGTESDCYVELVGTDLNNLFSSAQGENTRDVEEAEYTSVMIGTCQDSSYNARVKASATFDNTVWYTQANDSTLTDDESLYDYTTITFNQCRNYSILDNPVSPSGSATLSLYIDLRDIIRVIDISSNDMNGERYSTCSWTQYSDTPVPTEAPVICLTYPNVAGSIASTQPELRRYRLEASDTPNSAVILGLYFTSEGQPVGGYNRTVYNDTFYATPKEMQFKRAYMSNGALTVTDYVSGNTDQISGDGNNTIRNFPKDLAVDDSDGNVTVYDSSGSSQNYSYTVTRIE